MDHPLPPVDMLVRPWRVAAFVAASIAAVELLLLLAIGGGELAQAVSSRVQVAAKEHALAGPHIVGTTPGISDSLVRGRIVEGSRTAASSPRV